MLASGSAMAPVRPRSAFTSIEAEEGLGSIGREGPTVLDTRIRSTLLTSRVSEGR